MAGAVALRAVVVGAALLAGSGCSSYTQRALKVREPLAAGDPAAAEAFLVDKKPGGDGLPYLMELGLVLRAQGEYVRSNQVFDDAEILVDDLWTKSVSKEILALATSDETIPYDGEMWERVLINYYRALNYVDLGQYDEALVECRKINHKLKVYADASDDPPTYRSDAFAQWVTAILYEAMGDLDDADVSLRLAEQAYDDWRDSYGVDAPQAMRRDSIRLSAWLGDREEVERLRARWPDTTAPTEDEVLANGEIVLFWEEGFVPAKIQVETTIPILKHEYEDDHTELATTLSRRYRRPVQYRKTELEYLLRFALPAYPPPGPADRPGWAELAVVDSAATGPTVRTELAEDVGAIARRGLDDRMGGIVFKTIVRALGKYALTRATEDKKGEVAGTLMNLLTAATEKADTRSWITLPRSYQVARMLVPPGVHDLELRCYGPGGALRETVTFEAIEVGVGEVRFLTHRTF